MVHDTDVEIDMHFDRFALDVEVPQLANKHFVTRATKLDGVTFYFRQTRKLPELCAHPTLPPITGQARADAPDCLQQVESALPPQGGGPDGIWRLDLGNIELTHVGDVWLEDLRVRGKGAVNGRLFLWPGQQLDIASESAHWDDVELTLGADKPLAKAAQADVAATLYDMEVPKHTIWEEFTSADVTVQGAQVQLARLGLGGVMRGDVEFHVRDALVSAANVKAHADDFSVMVDGKKLAGVLDTRVRIDGQKRGSALAIRDLVSSLTSVKVDGKRFDDADFRIAALEGGRIDPKTGKSTVEVVVSGKSARPVLALLPASFGAAVASVAIGPDARITGAAMLDASLSHLTAAPLTFEGGALSISGNVTFLPSLKGTLVARVGPITKTVELP